jgi:hypothetical protein
MALFSKKEFADRCGMPSNKMAVYVKRNKVIVIDDQVDDSLPQNQAFLAKHGGKPSSAPAAGRKERSKREKPNKEVAKSFTLDLARKEIENEKAELGKQLLQSKIGKERGLLIPFETVKMGLGQHFRDISVFMGQGLDNLVSDVAHRTKLNINERAELRGSMERILNDATDRAIDATNSFIRSVQKEYSLKRGVGEKA